MPLTSETVRKDTARPRFHMLPVQNMALSEKEGRPIFEDKEMVEIRIPGDPKISWVGPVTEQQKIEGQWVDSRARFPKEYEAFKRGEQVATTGTPLEQWPQPGMTSARVHELKALNVFSVEDLAGITDGNLGRLGMGGRELRESARRYIDNAKEIAGNSALVNELSELRARLAALEGAKPETDKALEDCTEDELRAYIKRVSGKGAPGKQTRENLMARAIELTQSQAA